MINYFMHIEGLTCSEACKRLGIELRYDSYKPVAMPKKQGITPTAFVASGRPLPPLLWMQKNGELVAHAHKCLLRNPKEMGWLAGRGIDAEAVERYRLGWLPGEKGKSWYTRPLKSWGLPQEEKKRVFRFPRGLVIPRFSVVDGKEQVVALRIRRTDEDRAEFAPDSKYLAFKGSTVTPMLFLPEAPLERSGLVVIESELDGILCAEAARKAKLACGALALVSNTAKPDAATHDVCSRCACLLNALDFEPGTKGHAYTAKALSWWAETYPRNKDWPAPVGKDPGEAFQDGADIALWLELGLPPICHAAKAGAEKPVHVVKNEEGGGRPQEALPQDVGLLHGYMLRYPLKLKVGVDPLYFGFQTPDSWRRENWSLYGEMTSLVMASSEIGKWLDTHPIQDGIIDKDNLLKR